MNLVYEDAVVRAFIPERPASEGHVVIEPTAKATALSDLQPEVSEHAFWLASYTATALFEGLGAQGTNIVVEEGGALRFHVLTRGAEDGVGLTWDPKRGDPAELDETAKRVKEHLWYVGKEEQPKNDPEVARELQSEPPKKEPSNPKDNYKVRQLMRSP
jgi:histidine triad (HIT) family protein